jgi:hypothetical protein
MFRNLIGVKFEKIKLNKQTKMTTIEIVDSNQDLAIQCANIQSAFESSPRYDEDENGTIASLAGEAEHQLRQMRGTVVDIKTKHVVQSGSFYPYEFTDKQFVKCQQKMQDLGHSFQQLTTGYSFEGTIIRIFYHKRWYVSTHRKLDANRSKWGSNTSFQSLFESGLKESYNLTLDQLFLSLNLRCQYAFMVMADNNTRHVCVPYCLQQCVETVSPPKKVYLIHSTDNNMIGAVRGIELLPRPTMLFETLESVFAYVKDMSWPFTYQGLLMEHGDGTQYRIVSEEYASLFQVRNNEQSIKYRYVQLKCGGVENVQAIYWLKVLFPEYKADFDMYDLLMRELAEFIHVEYLKRKQLISNQHIDQIDQKVYLFIKTRLMGLRKVVDKKTLLDLLYTEEPSNINRMLQMLKRHKREAQKREDIKTASQTNISTPRSSIGLGAKPECFNTPTSANGIPNPAWPVPAVDMAPKKKKVYKAFPIEYYSRKKLF